MLGPLKSFYPFYLTHRQDLPWDLGKRLCKEQLVTWILIESYPVVTSKGTRTQFYTANISIQARNFRPIDLTFQYFVNVCYTRISCNHLEIAISEWFSRPGVLLLVYTNFLAVVFAPIKYWHSCYTGIYLTGL